MMNPTDLEASYQKYVDNLALWLPDGVIEVDLDLLNSLHLLDAEGNPCELNPETKDHSFYIFESEDKITLVNDEYIVWIAPQTIEDEPTTYTFVAKNTTPESKLELVFSSSGIYNSSAFILRILEAFLNEIDEHNHLVKAMKDS